MLFIFLFKYLYIKYIKILIYLYNNALISILNF